jgi:homoserine kinase type II
MAVYTTLSAAQLAALIGQYDVGELVSAKGSPVPRTIHDRSGHAYRLIDRKAVALIEFLPGVSVDQPSAAQARAVGRALAGIHLDAADFPGERANTMGLAQWRKLFDGCGHDGLAKIDPSLPDIVESELAFLTVNWPADLPRSVIHADLFPDNVLLLGDRVAGLIDFYFACTDITAYDLAVTHAAWCFGKDGDFRPDIAEALVAGYNSRRPLSEAEWRALPLLARGAALRFVATRSYDWLHTPADALVMRKDPMDFARRLSFYASEGAKAFPAPPR